MREKKRRTLQNLQPLNRPKDQDKCFAKARNRIQRRLIVQFQLLNRQHVVTDNLRRTDRNLWLIWNEQPILSLWSDCDTRQKPTTTSSICSWYGIRPVLRQKRIISIWSRQSELIQTFVLLPVIRSRIMQCLNE